MRTLLIILSLSFLISHAAKAQQRLALVIGNADYSAISPLSNPINDAEDIASKLTSLNFDTVILKKNLNHAQMKAAIRNFSQKIHTGDIAFFYYAGHGIQSSDTQNYLIPLRADIQDEADLEYQAINANWVLDNLKSATPLLKIMVLDACRDNPFRSFSHWRGSDSRGLARMKSNSGTIIAYAAGAGEKAHDGNGRNGLYTEELLKWLGKSGIEASQMFSKVSWKVSSNAQGKGQSPFLSIQAPPPFCFAGCENKSVPPTEPVQPISKPQAAHSQNSDKGTRIKHYIAYRNGTVWDSQRKLLWMRCSIGQTWINAHCTGTAKKMPWQEAMDYQHDFAGYADWRLATREELNSLGYCSTGKPAYFSMGKRCKGEYDRPTIVQDVFPNTPPDAQYWSSSSNARGSGSAWYVHFNYGDDDNWFNKNSHFYVRLVRSGQ